MNEVKWENFPFTSKVYNYDEDCETIWQKCCFYVVLTFCFVVALIIDILRLVIVGICKFVWNEVVIHLLWESVIIGLWNTILKSVIARLIGAATLIFIGFFLYWLIKSGAWESVYASLSSLWQWLMR